MKENTYIASNEKENLFFKDSFTYIASNDDILNNNYIDQSGKKLNIPLSIFSNGLSGLEAISKYLKDILNLRYCEIAKLLNRNDRTIWDACNSAKQKSSRDFLIQNSNYPIPLNIFNNRSLSVLETLTAYLKEEYNLRYCEIAVLLNKNDRTIWTAYQRSRKKRKNVENN